MSSKSLELQEEQQEASAQSGAASAGLLSRAAEDLAAGPPTDAFFQRLLSEIASQDTPWTRRLAGRLDYAYSEILLRAVAAGRTRVLRRLGEHLGRVLAIRRDELTRRGSPYFDRWQLLHEIAERRVLKRETTEALLDAAWVGDVLRLLDEHGVTPQSELAERLDLTASRIAQVLSDMARWELIARRKGTPQSKRGKLVWLTPLGQLFARKHAERAGEIPTASPAPSPEALTAPADRAGRDDQIPASPAPSPEALTAPADRAGRDDRYQRYDGKGVIAVLFGAAA